jgi:hypothetical protein
MLLVRPWPRVVNVTNMKADLLTLVNNPGEINVKAD